MDGRHGEPGRRARSVRGSTWKSTPLLIQVLAILAWQWDKAGAWILVSGLMPTGSSQAGWVWTWMQAPLPTQRRSQDDLRGSDRPALLVALWPPDDAASERP
jgi:hypothetical protein